jgi:hypothetical protein
VLPSGPADVIRQLADNPAGAQAAAPQIVLNGTRHGNFFITHIDDLAKALEYGRRNFVIKT